MPNREHQIRTLLNAVSGLAQSLHAGLTSLPGDSLPPDLADEISELTTDAHILLEKAADLVALLLGETNP